MHSTQQPTGERRIDATPNGHALLTVTETALSNADAEDRVYYRCRFCGQERPEPEQFGRACATPYPRSAVRDGEYDIDDPRTRRALTETMVTRFLEDGARYAVDSESGHTYEVDIAERTCTCPDWAKRGAELGPQGCKHLRRVELEILARRLPRPDGRFVR
ncbi:SWIM zinc finger family protein [Halarchaeum sp. P4]|uniref:SWIM zinc finger family protein n=1 Tax=Halarchaeum sp. P4 TaxID=3421639 RepID=UPI003EBB4DF5